MSKIFYVGIEPLENRYTEHWHEHHPWMLMANTDASTILRIEGGEVKSQADGGAFLNFVETSKYKARQLIQIAESFETGEVADGDVFIVTDAWNPMAHQIRYMADLQEINITMIGIWHAGSYDKWDFLGRKFKNKTWSISLEHSLYQLYDLNVFATEYHLELFTDIVGCDQDRSVIAGFPMEYYKNLSNFLEHSLPGTERKDIVVFPHRVSVEKNPEMFRTLAKMLPQYEFVIAQEVCNSKEEYHKLLGRAKVVWSCNLQETLGIGTFEAMLMGCHPIVPDRLSYEEMYPLEYRYYELDVEEDNLANQCDLIVSAIERYNKSKILADAENIFKEFFTGSKFYDVINQRLYDGRKV